MLGLPIDDDRNDNTCFLVSVTDPEAKFILLDKEPLVLGRTPLTGIVNPRLSKAQCE